MAVGRASALGSRGDSFAFMTPNLLQFTFIANACGVFTGSEGSRLLVDPWLNDGVFEGSWCHAPALSHSIDDLQDVDMIYVSHIHPDHFDDRFFDFRRDIPVIVLDRERNFLRSRLESLGFTNLVLGEDGKQFELREFKLTLYAPFTAHNFFDAKVGNVIDSALLIESGGVRAINFNDNTPTPDACRRLREELESIDLAMLNYNGAGPYPACFDNLSHEQKVSESKRILERNLDYMALQLEELRPKFCLPFAGAYVLGGRLADKNPVLGTMTWEECASGLLERSVPTEVVLMREGATLNVATGSVVPEYEPLDMAAVEEYIRQDLTGLTYPYERDPKPDFDLLDKDVQRAAELMRQRAQQWGLETSFSVRVRAGAEWNIVQREDRAAQRILVCDLDPRLLRRILDRKANWNSAEIGCHIKFDRKPNIYEPDLHTMLQLFHL